ncbi:MAG: hypothetical protein WBP75_00905 [Candidatus Cybelea sp.]
MRGDATTPAASINRLECAGSCGYGGRFSYPDGWGSPYGIGAF